jgi:hypothetical protein
VCIYIYKKKKKKKKHNWNGHTLRGNCLLNYVIQGQVKGMMEVIGRRGGRRQQLLDVLKEIRKHCKLKEEAVDLCGELALEGATDLL